MEGINIMTNKKDTTVISARIPIETNNQIDAIVEERGITKQNVIRLVLAKTKEIFHICYPTYTFEDANKKIIEKFTEEIAEIDRRRLADRRKLNLPIKINHRLHFRRAQDCNPLKAH
jgi:antitoxin component of RelBE/YafQ-DinJ toxin-antitoxin module